MKKPKSECCGADVMEYMMTGREYFEDLCKGLEHPDPRWKRWCLECHKPCSVAKLPKASKVKEMRDDGT